MKSQFQFVELIKSGFNRTNSFYRSIFDGNHDPAEIRTFPDFYWMPEVRKCSARYCIGVFPVFSRNTEVK